MFLYICIFLVLILLFPIFMERVVHEIGYRNRVVAAKINMDNAMAYSAGGPLYLKLEELIEEQNTQLLALYIDGNSLSFAQNQSLRILLQRIKASGKQVWVYLYARERSALYLSSIADRVYMLPTGSLFWNGLGGHHPFYKKFLDTLGLKADFERAGSYKSFAEPYTKAGASEEYREQYTALLSSIQDQMLREVSSGRDIDVSILREELGTAPFTAERAKELGLVDELAYEDQFELELESFTKSKTISLSRLTRWIRWGRRLNFYARSHPKIAVLHLEGSIHEQGEGGSRIIQDVACQQLKHLKESDSIKAVVLLVNSPGGSAQASECILREVELLNRKKPVVAFFSSVAASGGYYFSAMAGEIVALPGSITGSIGVVGGKVVVMESAKKLGINLEDISVGPDHDFFSFASSFSDDQRARFQAFLTHTYDRFLQVVSGGRGLPLESVARIAKGRVYTGEQALEEGLVDRLGGLDLAIRRAGIRANLKSHRCVHIRTKQSWKQKVKGSLRPMGILKIPQFYSLLHAHPLQPLLYWPECEDSEVWSDQSPLP